MSFLGERAYCSMVSHVIDKRIYFSEVRQCQQKKQITKEMILTTAMKLLRDHGYASVN